MTARGKFIVLEGGEGCGKSTQIELLSARLRAAGIEHVSTREPGGTPLGVELRRWLLDQGVAPNTEALLMAADRAHHVNTVIGPALDGGKWVLSDRHVGSSLAYQGVARGLGIDTIHSLSSFAVGGVVPDLVVLLDCDEQTAAERVPNPRDAIEASGKSFHRTVRSAYRELAAKYGWTVLDASETPASLSEQIWESVAMLSTER